MSGPCTGLTVLDFSLGLGGALATAVLADFGADVIKVEPPSGDPARTHPSFLAWNRGKRSIVLDLETAEGREQAEALARRADVVVESSTPGVMQRLGLGYDQVSRTNPRVVYASITGFGQKGRLKDLPAYEGLIAAKTGRMASFAGAIPRQGPMFAAVQVGTWAASQAAVRGILGALMVRDEIGKGQWVQSSVLQGMMCYIGHRSATTFFSRMDPVKFPATERGQAEPNLGYIPVRTKDGRWLQHANNMASPRLLKGHLIAIGLGWIYDDERFKSTPTLTKENEDALRELVLARMQEKTLDEWMEIYMQNPDVAGEPYLYTAEAFNHPQFIHNKHVVGINDPRVGPMKIVGLLTDMVDTPGEVGGPAPFLGQHTVEVLGGTPERVPMPVGGASTNGHNTRRHLLDGITMLDFSTVIQGPYGASMIADLGARVIKVDATPERSDNRRGGGQVNLGDLRTYAGKESLQVDLQTDEGKELIHKLIAKADVLLHNFRPGAPARLQIDYETCKRINPGLVYVYSGAYGATGPHNMRPGAHPVPGALFGGALRQAGRATPPPASQAMTMPEVRAMSRQMMRANEGAPDPNTSQAVGTAIMMGLLARKNTGMGQSIQVTMLCGNAWANFQEAFDYPGRPPYMIPDAEVYGLHALYRIYAAQNGHVLLATLTENEWGKFCNTVGRTDLLGDPRFAPAARQAHDEELAAALSEVFAARPAQEWEDLFLAQGIPCVRVMEPDKEEFWLDDSHAIDNELAVETENASERVGKYMRTGAIVDLSETPGRYRSAPYLGQHTQSLMREVGYSNELIEAWRERRILHWEEPSPIFS